MTQAGRIDDDFDARLVEFDEALATGEVPNQLGSTEIATPPQLARAMACVRLLDRIRRYHSESVGELPSEAAGACESADGDGIPARIGRFDIVRELGRGGYGVVFLAIDPRLTREVAIKVPRPEALVSPELRRRFLREAKAAACLDHPHIVAIYETASVGGLCYLASAYCDGPSLADWLASQKAPVPEKSAARFVNLLAHAVEHAHSRGVLHRDLKPGNVLLDLGDFQSDADKRTIVLDEFTPRISDFGLAKLAETEGAVTRTTAVLGTPSYMAPEQAAGDQSAIGAPVDVYGLGAILYELLTRRPPFCKGNDVATLQAIQSQEPTAPRRLRTGLSRELEAICLKCLERDPAGRYASAAALADDLERFTAGIPVKAQPVGVLQRTVKWCRRHKPVVWTAAVAAVLLLLVAAIGSGVSVAFIAQQRDVAVLAQTVAEDRRVEAIRQRDTAEQNLYLAHVRLAQLDWETNQIGRMLTTLERHRRVPGRPDRRGWEWYYLKSLCHKDLATIGGHTARVWSVAWNPDGRRLASASWDGTVKIWDARTGKHQATLSGHDTEVYRVAWSPDGSMLASGGTGGAIKIWDATTTELIRTIPPHAELVHSLAWSLDGSRIASAPWSGELVVHDVTTGEPVLKLPGTSHRCVAWSPNGRRLATGAGYYDSRVQIWDAETGEAVMTLLGQERGVNAIAFSPDGQRLASAAWDERVKIWDLEQGAELFDLAGHAGNVFALSWSPDGATLATAGADATVKLWDTKTGALQHMIRGHRGLVYGVDWSPDGSQLVSSGADGSLRIWDPYAEQEWISFEGQQRVAWSPDGGRLCTEAAPSGIRVIDAGSGRELSMLKYPGTGWLASVAWSPNGERIAAALSDGYVRVFHTETGGETVQIHAHSQDGDPAEARSVAWSPDGRLLATAGTDKTAGIWDAATGRRLHCLPLPSFGGSVTWNPDGNRLAVATWDQHVLVWDASSGRKVLQLSRQTGPVREIADSQYSIAWSPAGDRLAGGTSDGDIVVWHGSTGEELIRMRGHTSNVRTIAWSPNGRRLASSGEDRMVKIWDADSGDEVLTLLRHRQLSGVVGSLAWSPDGRRLAMAEPGLRIWDASAAYEMDDP